MKANIVQVNPNDVDRIDLYCEVCNKKLKEDDYKAIMFFPSEVFSIPATGINIVGCLECHLSYISQILNATDKEIKEYLEFVMEQYGIMWS